MTVADVVFMVLFLGSVCLAVVAALAWVSLEERKARRAFDPHSIERRTDKWDGTR